jgi:hypothetical protein
MEIADLVAEGTMSLDDALDWMMVGNYYPPLPAAFKPVFKKAIELVADGDVEANVMLPEGMTYKDNDFAPARAVVKSFHLEYLAQAVADGCTDDELS